jgi:hypothetical protein
MGLAYRLTFLLPPALALVPAGRHSPCIAGCVLVIEADRPLVVLTGPSREQVFEQAGRFLKVISKGAGPQTIAAVLESPCGRRDGWSIAINARVVFAPTALGVDIFPRHAPASAVPKDPGRPGLRLVVG